MNFKSIWQRIKNVWDKGTIQRTFRISYDVIWNLILFFLIAGLILFVFAGGVGAGYFASLVKDEPIRSYEEMQQDIYNYEQTSKIYFADNKYLGDVRADLQRDKVKLDNVSDLLKEAVIATEDEMFYEHHGVVPKAIIRAIYQEAANTQSQTGGSTLTQQIIKNQILTNEVSFERKAKEILLALRLEHFFEKDEILESYLNIIPYGRSATGRNIAGIQTAAQGVFGVDAKDLTLPQAAFLAGIPQNPYTYTPFDGNGKLKEDEELQMGLNRMQTVLSRMLDVGFITKEQYDEAKAYDITEDFTSGSSSGSNKYIAVVREVQKEAKEIIRGQLLDADDVSMEDYEEDDVIKEKYDELTERALTQNGYQIHSTINKKMYTMMKKIGNEYESYGPERQLKDVDSEKDKKDKKGKIKTEKEQSAAVLIENNTGKILSFFPGRDRNVKNEFNMAFQAERSPGSTIKPLSVYGPAFDLGKLQPGSVIADAQFPWNVGDNGIPFGNNEGVFYGLTSVREALAHSFNISALESYDKILDDNPARNYLAKMGIDIGPEGSDYEFNRSLALGGIEDTADKWIGSFATFGNQGKYNAPYLVDKIVDADGNTIYEHEDEKAEQVFSPQSNYLVVDILREVLTKGTASGLPSRLKYSSVDWAGKTGTSEDRKDSWFMGTNPNVTLGTWIGYEHNAPVTCEECGVPYYERTQGLWAQYINALSDEFPDLMAPSAKHKQPDGITSSSYCASSGMLPSKICQDAGLVRSDIYDARFTPTKEDNSLTGGKMSLVKIDGEDVVADSKTPKEFLQDQKGGITFNSKWIKENKYDTLSSLKELIPRLHESEWSKVIPTANAGDSDNVPDKGDVKKPKAPPITSANEKEMNWSHQSGQYIVGYRVYYAKDKKSDAKKLDHTMKTAFSLPKQDGIYYVKAVNYFGEESDLSKGVEVKTEKPKEDKKKDDKDKKKDDKKDKQNDKGKDSKKEDDKAKKDKDKDKDEKKDNNNQSNEND